MAIHTHITTGPRPTVGPPTGARPTTASGRVLWAKAAMLEAAKVWAGAIAIRSDASAEIVHAALDEVADIRDALFSIAGEFARALHGDQKALEPYFSDGIGDGLEFPLTKWLEDLGHEDANAEHRLSAGTQLAGRRW